MYSVYLALAVAVVLSLFKLVTAKNKSDTIGFSIVVWIVVAVVWLLGNLFTHAFVPEHHVSYGPTKLVAARTSDGMSGTFVWGSGGFQSETYYNMLVENKDGSLSPWKVRANHKVRIIEDEELKGVGYWTSTWNETNFDGWAGKWLVIQINEEQLVKHEIRVPKGTVVQNFTIE